MEQEKDIDEYLEERKENIINFKAMTKYFQLTDSMITIPQVVLESTNQSVEVSTPDAHVQSIGATHEDKVMFIKFLVGELFKKDSEASDKKLR